MGRQHGTLLAAVIPDGPIRYFREHTERLIGRSALGPLAPLLVAGLRRFVGRRVAAGLPDYALETVRGIADGSGIPLADLLDGCTMPDTLVWVVTQLARLHAPGPAVWHRLALGLGCTSAIAWGDATVDGRLLHARNFDYHGVECWPRTAAVVFHRPTGGQRYASVSSAGVGLGGVTAMNESGLTLTVHQHMFTDVARLGGTPIGVVGDRVMREASSLDDAERILGAHRPIGCWTYLVTDGKTREVLCWEENPERHAARRMGAGDRHFGYANIYLDKTLGAHEQDVYGAYWRHNLGRHRRVNRLLAERAGALDPGGMAAILGDPGDPRCRVRDSIAMALTVGSVVFRPEDGVFWVATGEAPVSRNRFVPFSLAAEGEAPEHGELAGAGAATPSDRAFCEFRRAYSAYVDRADSAEAGRCLDRARDLDPGQPVYHALAGMLALTDGDPRGGEARLDRALALGHPDEERVSSFHLWRARARDLDGQRAAAIDDYRAVLGRNADPPVTRAARRGLRTRFGKRAAARAALEMSLADCMMP